MKNEVTKICNEPVSSEVSTIFCSNLQVNSPINASIARGHFQSVRIFNDMSGIFTTKKNPSNVHYVTDVLVNKPTWIGI